MKFYARKGLIVPYEEWRALGDDFRTFTFLYPEETNIELLNA